MERRAGAGTALVGGEAEGIAADVGAWGTLDQAVAVQMPLRDPLRAYLDGLTSAASRATAIKRLRAVARLVEVPDYAALPWGQLRAHHVTFIRSNSSRPRRRRRRSTSRWPSCAGSRARPATST